MEDSWDQIGVRLKHAREKADLSVDDVVFRARIPRSVVEALEAEDFSVFTSPTYAKSFLRQYSEFLEVDADPWLNALEPAAYVGGDALSMFSGPEVSPMAKRPASENRQSRSDKETDSGGGRWSAVWVMFLTAALVVCLIKGYQTFDAKFGGESQPGKQASQQEAKSEPVKADAVQNPAETQPAPGTPEAGDPENPQPPSSPPRALIIRE